MRMAEPKRGQFSSKIGFVLAAAGSAVGLGNLWRFPYLAAQYGGGIFLLVYVLLVVTFGFTLMVTEIAIGRKTGQSAILAFSTLDRRFGFLGYFTALCAVLTLPYYSVIGGWVVKYFVGYWTGSGGSMTQDAYFTSFQSSTWEPILWIVVFVAATILIVLLGVQKGVETVSKFLIPGLVLLLIGLSIYVMTMPGALEGVAYYLKPDFTRFSIKTVLAALGQMFYSMSLTIGVMITYGSYMNRNNNIETSVRQIEWFDTGVAVLSGLLMVPAMFVFSGGGEAAMQSGTGLLFTTMPKVFAQSGGVGVVVGAVFFLLVVFAALTSSISILEAVVSILQDKLRWSRWVCCLVAAGIALALGIPGSLGFGVWRGAAAWLGMTILDFADFITNSVLMPLVAFITCVFVGYVLSPETIVQEVRVSSRFRSAGLFRVIIRYVAPVFLLAILIGSILEAAGVWSL